MATFAIDLISGNVFLFVPDFGGSTGTTSGSTYPEVNTYAELPAAGASNGEIYVVRTSTGAYVLNRKEAGLYYSNGIVWRRLGDIPSFFDSDNFQIYDGTDNSKIVEVQTSGITSGTTRTLTIQDADGTIAYLTDLDSKVDTSAFADYTGTTAPNTYLAISDFNTYSGATELILQGLAADIAVKMDIVTGHTNQVGFFDVNGQITGGTGMTYQKSDWWNVDGGGLVSGNTLYLDGILSGTSGVHFVDSPDFTGATEGLLHYSANEKALNFHTHIDETVIQIGQETLLLGVNKTGSLIPNGSVIAYAGAVQGNRPTIKLASGNTIEEAFLTIGLATSDIPDNEEGFVTIIGAVRELNMSAYSNGDILFLDTTGGTTNIQPTYPDPIVRVGIVRNNHPNVGQIGVKIDYFYDPDAYLLIQDFNTYTALTQTILDGKQDKLALPLQLKDISGITEVNTIPKTPIVWTTEEYSGTSLNFSGGSRIYILETASYNISYLLNLENQTSTRKIIGSIIRKNGVTDVTPLSSSSYSRNAINDASTNSMPQYKVDLDNGDYVELLGFRIGSSGSVLTVPDGSWFKIEKII